MFYTSMYLSRPIETGAHARDGGCWAAGTIPQIEI